jgi:hypothetical protein
MRLRKKTLAPAWRGAWETRIARRIKELGYDTYPDYLAARPGQSYWQIAQELSRDEDVAPVQLQRMHASHVKAGDWERAVLDSFARYLRGALRRGWGLDKYWESSVAGALSSWYVTWGGGPELDAFEREVFLLHPKPGWIPKDSEDSILREAARRAWRCGSL